MEALARKMIAEDPSLKTAFEARLKNDPAFAASLRARLAFFFERSPWYMAQKVGAYPVLRLDDTALKTLDATASGESRNLTSANNRPGQATTSKGRIISLASCSARWQCHA